MRDTKTTGLATTAFLLLIVSTTELPYILKYPMIGITVISLILSLYKVYKGIKNQADHKNIQRLNG